jgi:hypothetical protein
MLPEKVALMLGLPGVQREVLADPSTALHIYSTRSDIEHADVVFGHASGILANPEFCGRDGRTVNRFVVAGHYDERGCLRLPLKYIQANVSRSGGDEIWLQTGHMINAVRLDGYLRTGKLMRVR